MQESLAEECNRASAECEDAKSPKSGRIRIRMVRRYKFSTIREDTDQDEERGEENKKQGGHSYLQVSGLLSSSVTPQ